MGENLFEIPSDWVALSQIARPVSNQFFTYMGFQFEVNSLKDVIIVKKDDKINIFCLSAFLLKLDPTFKLNQVLGFEQDICLLEIRKLSKLLRSSRIITDFLVYGNLLYVILSTNRKNYQNYSYAIDVSNHFYILCEENGLMMYWSFLYKDMKTLNIPSSETGINYIHYIRTLLEMFI